MAEKTLGKLKPADLRELWTDEARDFTPWLAREENIALLSDALGMELEVEGVGISVGQYFADIVARDISSNTRVLIENQLEKTNHDHLGKIITYASGLDANVIIWIAKEFSEEHRRAIDFLNENSADSLRFFGVEIQLWRIEDSLPAPMFNIIASPNVYASTARSEEKALTETKGIYLDFWTGFKDFGRSRKTYLSLRKPRPQHWFSIAVGRSTFAISLTASIQKKRLGCEIYMRGENAKRAFRLIEKSRKAVEELTGPLEWQELPEGQDCRIALHCPHVDISNHDTWQDAFDWLLDKAELFHRVFSPLIKDLPILDSIQQEETSRGGEEA